MKILHVTNYDNLGGAGIAAYRLHAALRKTGVDSRMLVRTKGSPDPFVSEVGGQRSEDRGQKSEVEGRLQRARQALQRIPIRARGWLGVKLTNALGMNGCSLNIFPTGLHKRLNASDADIVHLHWINNEMISIKEIAKINKPLVWTLHDCWPLLGAEHHSEVTYWKINHETHELHEKDCLDRINRTDRIGSETSSLNKEPKAPSPQPLAPSVVACAINRWIFQKKQKAWENLNVRFVAPSNWMAEQVRQSRLFSDAPVVVIPNGLDSTVFKPMDQTECRRKFDLLRDKQLILFGAYNPLDPNKGSDLLEQALTSMPKNVRQNVELVVFGANGEKSVAGLKTHWMGSISSEHELAMLYNVADVVCVPSRKESFGQTAFESLACGVPVAAFRTTGLIDIVDHQENGYLADPFDTEDLANGISWILNDNRKLEIGNQAWSVTCFHKAETMFSPQSVAQKYSLVYRNLITNNG